MRTHQAKPNTPADTIASRARSLRLSSVQVWGARSDPDRARRPRNSRSAPASTPAPAAILIRLNTVTEALLSSLQNGQLAKAGLLERGLLARLTPRKSCPDPHSSGRNQSTGISANRT